MNGSVGNLTYNEHNQTSEQQINISLFFFLFKCATSRRKILVVQSFLLGFFWEGSLSINT